VYDREHSEEEHPHQMYLDRLAEAVQSNVGKGQPKGAEVKVTTKVEAGEPPVNICNLVDKNKIDLIIMTAVSTTGLNAGKMLGSVTDHVCRTVPIPIMLIRPKSVKPIDEKRPLFNRMLIPLDGSEFSKIALPVGEELAAKLKVSTTLFQMANMIRPQVDAMGEGAYIDYSKLDEDEKKRVTVEMIALEKELSEKGLDVTSDVTSGLDAAADIVELCKKLGVDLVVMSTHGRSGLGRLVLGNVAEIVLHQGETPLLLVHARAG
jgi:nucleotide-binding universal stress UspA family protein